ncbi:MAG: hypothetical protein IPL23_19530 [Saprospiraceae bacterium]|nr:hypothetical protein [Saprospiraceae bacterium]MBK8635047.1 hypothetical protein [Saprospiraceae bacterium]
MKDKNTLQLDLPQLDEINEKLDLILKRLDSIESGWLTAKQFQDKFEISQSTFQLWRNTGLIVTKKIGKHVFVDLKSSLK